MADRITWYASLSDGTSAQEGQGDYAVREGGLSPWQRLLAFCVDGNKEITSLSLRCGEIAWNLPSAGKNPKFREFDQAPKPIKFMFYRKAGLDYSVNGKRGREDMYAVIRAEYADGTGIETWVDERTLASWTLGR